MKRLLLCLVVAAPAMTAHAAPPSQEALEALGAKVKVVQGAVTELQVDAAKFTEENFKALGQTTSLKKLTISGKTIDDKALAALAGLVNLEELSTNNTMLSDDGYQHFKPFQKLRSLALFHPSWDLKSFTGTGLTHLKALPNLERLTFAGSTAGDTAMQAIGQISQLKEFSTWHTAQTQEGNKHLLNLKELRALKVGQRLPKWGAKPPPSFDATTIPLIAQMKSLQRLELFEARLTAKDLEPLKELTNLQQLSIHTTDITPADIEAVQSQLKQVKVVFKPLTDEQRTGTLEKKLKL